MNWTGGRLHRYSTVTRRGNPKDERRRRVHKKGASFGGGWRYELGHKGQFGARPTTAFSIREYREKQDVMKRANVRRARSMCSVNYAHSKGFLSSSPGTSSARQRPPDHKTYQVYEISDINPVVEEPEELEISDEEVLRFTRRTRDVTSLQTTTVLQERKFLPCSNRENLLEPLGIDGGKDVVSNDLEVQHVVDAGNYKSATLSYAEAATILDAPDGLGKSHTQGNKSQSYTSADLDDAREKLLRMNDWAMLRFCKPLKLRQKRGG
ncbi:hypothetical protein AAP_03370 [Ascosphaera apis ARSEF 7405]|uniref:Uncharacterized protein n=1 Tax=Ascosphaera apis ARSEF 7405 TaxID=392613 RepID=A0A167YRA0_9EURO|nr:hypothetical protein AAP_03370 [Ascosphaera apis ARSEF 7405]